MSLDENLWETNTKNLECFLDKTSTIRKKRLIKDKILIVKLNHGRKKNKDQIQNEKDQENEQYFEMLDEDLWDTNTKNLEYFLDKTSTIRKNV
jgi:hypothetical protein